MQSRHISSTYFAFQGPREKKLRLEDVKELFDRMKDIAE